MELIGSIYNIVNKVLDKNINILYDCHSTVFDHLVKMLDINLKPSETPQSDSWYYDFAIINHWDRHAVNRNIFIAQYQILDILYFHDLCANSFKKEDKTILTNNLKTTFKIYPTEDIYTSWGLNDTRSKLIRYGIPVIEKITNKSKDEILLVDIGSDNTRLYEFIKNSFPNTNIIKSIDNYDLFCSQVQQAKVVIDLNYGINNLFAIASGTYCISTKTIDKNLKSNIIVNDIKQILAIVSELINRPEIDHSLSEDINYIRANYSMKDFTENMTSVFNKIKSEPFIT